MKILFQRRSLSSAIVCRYLCDNRAGNALDSFMVNRSQTWFISTGSSLRLQHHVLNIYTANKTPEISKSVFYSRLEDEFLNHCLFHNHFRNSKLTVPGLQRNYHRAANIQLDVTCFFTFQEKREVGSINILVCRNTALLSLCYF